MAAVFKAGGTTLPSPVKVTTSNEIIWSSNTGRSTESGKLIGDVIANKRTVDVEWGILTEAQVKTICNALPDGFFSFSFRDDGEDLTITVYRGTIKKEQLGYIGDGTLYYKNASVSLIQQ